MRPCNCHAVYERSRDLEERLAAAQSEIATLKRLLANRGMPATSPVHVWVRHVTAGHYQCSACGIKAYEPHEVILECGADGMPGTRRRVAGGRAKR